jgi:hypothetical protein
LLVIAVVVAIVRGGVWRRHLRAGSGEDILGLLRGAAVRPRAFETIHSLSSRRVLRLLDGRSASLSNARRWARKGRLASGTSRFDLARRAARGGGAVLDLEQPEGAAVAEALAAVNLDRWQRMLDAGVADELTTRVEARLRSAGEPCHIIVADLEGMEMDVLDGAGYGLEPGELWVVLDKGGSPWQSVCRVADLRPARAAFALADIVMSRVGTPQAVQQRCLSGLALEALREAAGHGT